MANPHPNVENLKPFKSGVSGNPAGSSKRARLRAAIIRLLDEKELDATFAKAGMDEALKGVFLFWREILNRVDGPVEPAMAAVKLEEYVQTRATAALDDEACELERTEQIDRGVALLCAAEPQISRELAERYIRELVPMLEAQRRNVALLRGANPMAPLAKSPREMEEALIKQVWMELDMPGDPDTLCLDGPGDRKHQPPPLPTAGPAPCQDPDRAFLEARAVEAERQRRERAKHPMQPPPPAPEPPVTPDGGPPPEPPRLAPESDEYIYMRAAMWNSERERRR